MQEKTRARAAHAGNHARNNASNRASNNASNNASNHTGNNTSNRASNHTGAKKGAGKKLLIGIPVALLIVAAVIVVVYFLFFKFDQNIATIESSTQNIGGATSTNYLPILADEVNWDALNADERAGTARYAVNTAIEKAKTDQITIYTVTGLKPANRQPVFLYTGEDKITIYDGSEQGLKIDL